MEENIKGLHVGSKTLLLWGLLVVVSRKTVNGTQQGAQTPEVRLTGGLNDLIILFHSSEGFNASVKSNTKSGAVS